MTRLDHSRLLILTGYVIARLSDLQFERAGFITFAGLTGMAIFHWWLAPWMERSAGREQ